MRHIAVTIPASFTHSMLCRLNISNHTRFYKILVQLTMTTDTIVHNHLIAFSSWPNSHRFAAHRKNIRMIQTIFGFKKIFPGNIFVRDMAIVAIGPHRMRTVHPRVVIRGHDMAIDTSRRIVREVRIGPGNINRVHAKPCGYSADNNQRHDPPARQLYNRPFSIHHHTYRIKTICNPYPSQKPTDVGS